ncbi:phosphatidylinositol 3-kinase regulatory subunit alpha-like [Geospiza fortis]|uniref:Phosphatidylinositol 3-kinase regulatory subunit alpha-like n=1 Tax=Geospiza fortis TaxID=48883 RepID=A0A8N5ERC5_GEOFO|nr:phosphatidylinositol 3-kinase regulatory subunit alpha-like [Geospiza fortis]
MPGDWISHPGVAGLHHYLFSREHQGTATVRIRACIDLLQPGHPGQAELSEQPALPEQALPTVARLIEALEKQGLDSEVLYRPGPAVLGAAELKQALLADASAVDMDLYEAQTLADALKWYLQELPTPLIPPALYSDLVHMAQETPGLEECGQRARALLAPPALPQPQALLLRQLARHFCRLCQGSPRSRPSPRLLGELFGELLLRPGAASTEAGPELRARILESFIMASEVAELPAAPETLIWGHFLQPLRRFTDVFWLHISVIAVWSLGL